MFRGWFSDLFCKIEVNYYGDFVITLNENETYLVKHDDLSIWHYVEDQEDGHWEEVK